MSEYFDETRVTFTAEDSQFSSTQKRGEANTWTEQCDMFFEFLLGQGFIVSETSVANHFQARADDMGDFRSNPDFSLDIDESDAEGV